MKTPFILLLLAFSALYVNAQITETDKKFIDEAAQGGILEVKLGELAQTKSATLETKELAQEMIADHTKINGELALLAARMNVTMPITLNEKEQKTYDGLAAKNGLDFDKAYAQCMIKDHKKDIYEFKNEAKHGNDADLKGFASAKITVLTHHKKMAKNAFKASKLKN